MDDISVDGFSPELRHWLEAAMLRAWEGNDNAGHIFFWVGQLGELCSAILRIEDAIRTRNILPIEWPSPTDEETGTGGILSNFLTVQCAAEDCHIILIYPNVVTQPIPDPFAEYSRWESGEDAGRIRSALLLELRGLPIEYSQELAWVIDGACRSVYLCVSFGRRFIPALKSWVSSYKGAQTSIREEDRTDAGKFDFLMGRLLEIHSSLRLMEREFGLRAWDIGERIMGLRRLRVRPEGEGDLGLAGASDGCISGRADEFDYHGHMSKLENDTAWVCGFTPGFNRRFEQRTGPKWKRIAPVEVVHNFDRLLESLHCFCEG